MKDRLRLAVFRSNKAIYAQIIDDEKRETLVAASDKKLKIKNKQSLSLRDEKLKIERAREVGKMLAEKAQKLGIKKVKFDRRSYKYHGRVKALAEAAREGGLEF